MTQVHFTVFFGEDNELSVTADVSPIIPAKLYGDPEDCYPAEGGEVEIEECVLVGQESRDNPAEIEFAYENIGVWRCKDPDTGLGVWDFLEDIIVAAAIDEASQL